MPPVGTAVNFTAVPAGCGATLLAVSATAVMVGDGAGGFTVSMVMVFTGAAVITKSIAVCTCDSSAVTPALRTHTVTRPFALAAVGVHVNVFAMVQLPTGFQPSS